MARAMKHQVVQTQVKMRNVIALRMMSYEESEIETSAESVPAQDNLGTTAVRNTE